MNSELPPIDWKHTGNWLKIGIKSYRLPGEDKPYEVIERIGKSDHDQKRLDGVNMLPIAISKKNNTKWIVIEKIYRAPVDKYCIEFPGGLLEPNETKEDAAIRELKEETGYTGIVIPNMFVPLLPVCSGTGSESTCLIPMLIDLDKEENDEFHRKQQLDEDEIISAQLIPLNKFSETIKELHDEGYGVDLQVFDTAFALQIKEKLQIE